MKLKLVLLCYSFITGNIIFYSYASTMVFTDDEIKFTQTNRQEINTDDLKTGMSLYQKKCGKCHYLYKPEKYSSDKWNQILPKMAKKSNLSETEEKLILKYVLTKSKKTEPDKENIQKNEP